jgi:hypothetical protein
VSGPLNRTWIRPITWLRRCVTTWCFSWSACRLRVDYPKMPGEPKRVQPSRAKRVTSDDTQFVRALILGLTPTSL